MVGNVILTAFELLPTKFILPLVVTAVKLPIVKVALSVGCVNVILLRVVTVAAPNVGVVNVGDVNVLFVSVSVPVTVEYPWFLTNAVVAAVVELSLIEGVCNVVLPIIFKLPFNETSPLTYNLPLSDKSSLTINW